MYYSRNNKKSSYSSDRNDRNDRKSYGSNRGQPKWGTSEVDSYKGEPKHPAVPFEKNFYKESNKLSESEVEEFRRKHDMRTHGDVPQPYINFKDTPFSRDILESFTRKNYTAPTPIQAQGWPMALTGQDMVGIAQTGSGKTLSFVLPALIHAKAQEPLRPGDGPIVLVLAPTRELVLQIKDVFDEYARFFGMKCTAVYGGVSSYNQKRDIEMGCEIVVAAPGRLIDLNEQGVCFLNRVSFLILDEADRMLDMGFEPQIKKIIAQTNPDRQTLMWSATWPKEVKRLAESYMTNYFQITVGSEDLKTNKKIKQEVFVIREHEKNDLLMDCLKKRRDDKIIIFTNKKRTCDDLEHHLYRSGFKAKAIHGDKTQNIRDSIISDFRSGYKNILIATDVVGRGLDIKDVSIVINYDFPNNIEDYVHRIGRTARGDTLTGLSHSYVTSENRGVARDLIKMLKDANQEVKPELTDLASQSSYGRGNSRYGGSRNYRDYY
ncbi:ATP-dependent RNA helicase DBP2 [Nosema bombycis CQ1]|uniref:RNA helicase n=1 Tax=Nosema bombycis (strain CQ1 / CVCC 102059) TaxID=578461 RepID=R0MA67_NOSB1|nr:ATP-dependent RNA helicase DBP2 [Nosema bombycis CQ1]|eukprot:EOB14849.1 ATP-dependent RNA helicase DBP2 [Nosema bombycis CQ1]